MVKKRALGKGLNALLGTRPIASPTTDEASGTTEPEIITPTDGLLRNIPIENLQRGIYQPRNDMNPEALEDLASSIRAQGVVQPIVVRQVSSGKFEIIAGERRWRAAQIAQLAEIPAVIRDVPDRAAIAMSLIENIQREELNPMEEAQALQRLIDEFEMTHQQAADAVGRSRAAVSNLLRLLGLTPDVRRMVENGDLEMGHARALLALDGELQLETARLVVGKGMSVRETERLVKQRQEFPEGKPKKMVNISPDIKSLQQSLGDKLGASVAIQHGTKGKGKLVIQYHSLDELDGIIAHIK